MHKFCWMKCWTLLCLLMASFNERCSIALAKPERLETELEEIESELKAITDKVAAIKEKLLLKQERLPTPSTTMATKIVAYKHKHPLDKGMSAKRRMMFPRLRI